MRFGRIGPEWLELVLEIRHAGSVRRYGVRDMSVPRAGGADAVPIEGAALEIESPAISIDPYSREWEMTSGAVSLQLDYTDYIRLRRGTTSVQLAVCSIYVVDPAGPWESRVLLGRGGPRSVRYNKADGVLSFALAQPRNLDSAFPPRLASVERFANLPDKSVGLPLPVLYGSVYWSATIVIQEATNDNRLLIACHPLDTRVSANATVHRTTDINDVADLSIAIQDAADGLGDPYTYVALSDAQYLDPNTGDPYQITVDVTGKEGVSNVADVALDMIRTWTVFTDDYVDDDAFDDLRSNLDVAVGASFSGEEGAGVLETLANRFSDPWPISWVWHRGRFGPRFVSFMPDTPLTLLKLGDELIEGTAEIDEVDIDDLLNTFAVQYYYQPLRNRFQRIVEMNPRTNPVCADSAGRYGQRVGATLQFVDVYDDHTARRLADELVYALGFPHVRASYVGTGTGYALEPGRLYQITDRDQGWWRQEFVLVRYAMREDGYVELDFASRTEPEVVDDDQFVELEAAA